MKKIIGLIAALLISSNSYSDQILEPRTVKAIFSEGTASAGFSSNEGFSMCTFGLMYLDLAKESGKAEFSMLLSAKATQQKITRIDYTITSGICYITGLHIQ